MTHHQPRREATLTSELLALADKWEAQANETSPSLIGNVHRTAADELRSVVRRYT